MNHMWNYKLNFYFLIIQWTNWIYSNNSINQFIFGQQLIKQLNYQKINYLYTILPGRKEYKTIKKISRNEKTAGAKKKLGKIDRGIMGSTLFLPLFL